MYIYMHGADVGLIMNDSFEKYSSCSVCGWLRTFVFAFVSGIEM